jgi:hypothetical protein
MPRMERQSRLLKLLAVSELRQMESSSRASNLACALGSEVTRSAATISINDLDVAPCPYCSDIHQLQFDFLGPRRKRNDGCVPVRQN